MYSGLFDVYFYIYACGLFAHFNIFITLCDGIVDVFFMITIFDKISVFNLLYRCDVTSNYSSLSPIMSRSLKQNLKTDSILHAFKAKLHTLLSRNTIDILFRKLKIEFRIFSTKHKFTDQNHPIFCFFWMFVCTYAS